MRSYGFIGYWIEIARLDANTTSYADQISPGMYWYFVQAYNGHGSSPASNVVTVVKE
jgi:hypothetical protein